MNPGAKLRTAEEYGFDEKSGYVPFLYKEVELPEEFSQWRELAENIPALIEDGTIRSKVDELPLLDYKKLVSRDQKVFAKGMLSVITTAYVWGGSPITVDTEGNERKLSIPKQLAVPLWKLSQDLGNQPVVDYNDLTTIPAKAIAPIDLEGEYEDAIHFMEWRFPLPGGEQAKKFFEISVGAELRFIELFRLLPKIVSEDVAEMIEGLDGVAQILERVRGLFPLYSKYVEPEVFFTKMMPLMQGFGYDPTSPFPEGIIFDGVPEAPKKLVAPSAAQSVMFHCLDELFGVEYEAKIRAHYEAIREGMFTEQRLLLNDLRKFCIKTYVFNSGNDQLKTAYEKCLKAMQQCRASHLATVTTYVVQPAKKRFPVSVDDNPMLQHPTGRTLGKFLGGVRQDTVALQKSLNQ